MIGRLHPIIHFAFFFTSLYMARDDTGTYHYISIDQYEEGDLAIRNVCWLIRWGHFAEVVIPLLCTLFKKRETRQITAMIMVLSNIFGYLLPVLFMFYYASKYYENLCYFDTPYSNWIYFEILFLVSWIFSTALFLLLAYSCKYRSHQRQVKNKFQRDIWQEKDVDDFLHYIALEYRQFCLPTSMCFVDYFTWGYYAWHLSVTGENWFDRALEVQILN